MTKSTANIEKGHGTSGVEGLKYNWKLKTKAVARNEMESGLKERTSKSKRTLFLRKVKLKNDICCREQSQRHNDDGTDFREAFKCLYFW